VKKHLYRLLTAAIISSSVFAGTYAWYTATEKSNLISNDEKPVAFVGTLTDEIQRRQASRLL
jgi:predicted ribosomally synthesized peptide with SipW-like signal peptide